MPARDPRLLVLTAYDRADNRSRTLVRRFRLR
jgi:hypothetical protein